MPAPATTAELVELVRKSGLVEPERLEAFVARAAADPGPATPRHWAGLLVVAGLVTRFQAEQMLLGKWRGFTVGRYRVLERIGSGGAGAVYLCEHVRVRRKVAVKVLPTVRANNPAALGRFHREARAAGVLDHPNLVKCHDVDQDGELHYLVMDYVDGSNLHEVVARTGPLAPVRAAQYVRQAAQGLQHAHEAGLVHRDIKPANILVDRGGTVRVLDLGLARFFNDDQDLLTLKYDEHNVLGTADYVAPEQALNSHAADIRADVYSLGCTFYFLLTARPPFPDGKAAQKLIYHQSKAPTPVRQLRPEVPAEMAAVLDKMVAKDPGERHQTPAEVVAALEPWAHPPVPPPRDDEMPQLCPAAARQVSAPDQDLAPITPPGPDRPAPARPPGLGGGDADGVVPLLARPGRPARAADLETPSAMASPTAPEPGGRNAPPPAAPAGRPVLRRRLLRAAAAVAVVAALGLGLRLGIARQRGTADSPDFTVFVVSRAGGPGVLPTVQEALLRARPGDHVRVEDDTWEESLHLTGEGGAGRDVVLEGGLGRPVVWRAPRGHRDDQPLVYLACVPGFRLRNFTLDGQDRVQDLVALSGPCPGLALEDVLLKGFSRSAVVLADCAGDGNDPVTLRRLRAVPTRTADAALRFEGRPGEGNRSVRVLDARLEGPYRAAVTFTGPATDVEFAGNRVFNARDGFVYRRTAPPAALGLALSSNTFCNVGGVAVRFETSPPAEYSRVALTGNLFARVGTLARTDDFVPRPANTQAAWIWTDEPPGRTGALAEHRAFRKKFTVDGPSVSQARLDVAADAAFTVWVNGERVGRGDFLPHLRRVQTFDVAGYLRPGLNAVAIQGTDKTGVAGVLARLAYGCPGAAPVTLVSDASWKAFRSFPFAWQRSGFDDTDWPAAKIVAAPGQGPPEWRNLTWDALVEERFGSAAATVFPEPSGNVRDGTGEEDFPPVRAAALRFELPTDPSDDDHFLRFDQAGTPNGAGSPGTPADK
jgi:hypothetical protein